MVDQGPPRHFIVLVPGYMGSLLRDPESDRTVWLDVPALISNPLKIGEKIDWMLDKLVYRPDYPLAPAGIMDRGVLYVLPWAKLDHYGRLLEAFKNLGYTANPVTQLRMPPQFTLSLTIGARTTAYPANNWATPYISGAGITMGLRPG